MKSKKSKSCIRNIISFLTLICFLAGSFVTAEASRPDPDDGAGTGTDIEVPDTSGNRVVFENEEDPVPVLYVTKTLDTGGKKPEGADPKVDAFTFTLLVQKTEGGEWEKMQEKEYTVTDSEGKPVTNSANGDSFFKLTSQSTFTLHAGETAKFGFLRQGWRYKVTENGKDHYSLKSILINNVKASGKEAKGQMPLGPERVEMINGYKTGDGRLKVSKELVFVPGYTPPQSPVFEFQLTFPEEETQKQYMYTLYRKTDTDYLEKIEEGLKTGMDGKFTLLGGQVAEFQDLPEGAIYEVKELGLANVPENADRTAEGGDWQSEEWWRLGEEEWSGNTDEAGEAPFQNSNVSFAVSKRLGDYTELTELPEEKPDNMSEEEYEEARQRYEAEKEKMTFTFYLTDGDRGIQARYYLYYSLNSKNPKKGTRVDEIIHETEEDGRFRLLPGQTAVFLGMKPGSYYKVREAVALNLFYTQTEPKDMEGYAVRQVGDSPQELKFVNEPIPAGLRVTKDRVNYKGEEPPDTDAEFTFVLEKKVGENGWQPVGRENYKIGEDESLQTSENGQFTLKACQEAMFTQLERDAVYRVGEVVSKEGSPVMGNPDGYNASEYEFSSWQTVDAEGNITLSGNVQPIDYGQNAEAKVYYTDGLTLAAKKNITFSFVNNYVPDKLDLELLKVDFNDEALSGAEFTLYKGDTANQENIVRNPEGGDRFITGENGIVTIRDLKAGNYILQEMKAPSGYALLEGPIPIRIVRKGSQVEVIVNDKTVSGEKLEGGEPVATGVDDIPNVQVTLNQNGNDQVKLTVYNAELYELPNSGGIGIYWYSIGGVLLMMAAALILYIYKQRGEVLRD